VRLLTQPYPGSLVRKQVILGSLVTGGLAWMILRFGPFRVAVEGASMAPTLLPGDFLVATRWGVPRRGSMVVVEHPARPGYEMVKRIAAGTPDREGFWLLGDNPAESTDSRTLGPMPAEAIRGVIRLRYWPASRFRLFG
jgi:nickel-type superoxide dismutase maturation protease